MPRLALSLAIHNHQPVGNFDHVVAEATDRAYAPMIEALERHPRIRLALHYSGSLLDWLNIHRPDLPQRIRALVTRGQVEMLTGGYYEPILSIIPDADKRGQIAKLTRAIAEEFGSDAEGLWLAERVWEPHLPRPLGEAGVRYTIVDDTHFRAVGVEGSHLLGYYITEEEGVPLAIFPSLKRLRYLIPWASVENVLGYLRTLAEDARPDAGGSRLALALMGDDGEKFGLWPGTYAHCWERGWMDRLFEAIEAASWIDVLPPGDYLRSHEPAGAIYLPTATYDEMSEWALPAEPAARLARLKHELESSQWADAIPYIRGGFWRHFLVKYSEVNTLHHLALRASKKVASMEAGPDKTEALGALWAGEANCAYWHGVFGGIYLPHIRGAAFGNLIAAEALADAGSHPGAYARGEMADLDGDGRMDVRLSTEILAVTVDPGRGGTMVEWDYRPARRHLGNVLTRRREGYHADILKAVAEGTVRGAEGQDLESIHTVAVRVRHPGLERVLVYDRSRRVSLRMHLLPSGTTIETVSRDEQQDLGGFASAGYRWDLREMPGRAALELHRRAPVEGGQVSAERVIEVSAGAHGLRHVLRLGWHGEDPVNAVIAEEWGLGLFGAPEDVWAEAAGRRISLHEPNAFPACDHVTAGERHSGLTLSFALSAPASIWTFPLFTISNSESGYERNFQGAVLLLCRPFEVGPGGTVEHTTECTAAFHRSAGV